MIRWPRVWRAGASGGDIFPDKESRRRALIGVLFGLVMACGASWTWLALCAAFWLLRGGWGWFGLGVGYFGVTLRWIVEPFLVDPAATGWMAPFALIAMVCGMALFWGVAGRFRRVAVALICAEMARAFVLTGFPWGDMALAMMDTPAAWLLPLGGPRLVTAVIFGAAGLVALSSWRFYWALAGAVVLAMPGPGAMPDGDGPLVRVVQPNVPQEEKWLPENMPAVFDRMVDLTAGGAPAALTLWPEMATAYDMAPGSDVGDRAIAAARGGALIAGVPAFEGLHYFNSLIALQADVAPQSYHKTHLVPFGEYLPPLFHRLGLAPLATGYVGDYSAGRGPDLLQIAGIGAVRPLICYEGIFAEEVRRPGPARLMVLATNDAWFGTGPGPRQHLAQARMRALELGVPLIRSAGTGISAIIDARGHIVAEVPLGQMGAVAAPLPAALPPTVYAKAGEWPALILIGLLTLVAYRVDRTRRAV